MSRRKHPYFDNSGPIAMAHRGGAAEATENSPATFQRAIDLGYRWIETDLRATIDGHGVLIHDASLDRTTDAVGAISTLPLSEVRTTTLADGQHPITLVDALRRWPRVRFNVDLKAADTLPVFLRAIDDTNSWDRVCAASFDTGRLRRLRRLAGDRLATSMGPVEVARLLVGLPTPAGAHAVQVPRSVGPLPVVTRRFVERSHRYGIDAQVWTIDDAAQIGQLLDLGVDGIVSDRPSVLREVLIQRGAWY